LDQIKQFGLDKKRNQQKAEAVVKKLNANLIFDVNAVDNSASADLRILRDKPCSCVLCSFRRLDFLQACSDLSLVPLGTDLETMKHA
jgi:hypothetical protein